MDTALEQDAIDQLFTMHQSAREDDDLQAHAPPYNFGRAGLVGSDQMRAILRNLSSHHAAPCSPLSHGVEECLTRYLAVAC